MGYYTRFDISSNSKEVQDKIEEVSDYSFYNGESDEIKWYSYHEDMCLISKEYFPDTVLFLEGEGEEQGDVWKASYYNGKETFVKAVLAFPEVSGYGEPNE